MLGLDVDRGQHRAGPHAAQQPDAGGTAAGADLHHRARAGCGGDKPQRPAGDRGDRSRAADLGRVAPGSDQHLVLGQELIDVGRGDVCGRDDCLPACALRLLRQPSGSLAAPGTSRVTSPVEPDARADGQAGDNGRVEHQSADGSMRSRRRCRLRERAKGATVDQAGAPEHDEPRRCRVDASDLGGRRPRPLGAGLPAGLPAHWQHARRRGPDAGGLRPRVPLPGHLLAGHLRGLAAPDHHQLVPGHGAAAAADPVRGPGRGDGPASAGPSPPRRRRSTTGTSTATSRPR